MAGLTIEQLDNIADVLYDMEDGKFNPSRYAEASLAVEVELDRRKHGPFTLAEAIASGRPFRRKDPNTNGKWMTASYLDTYDYADESDHNDYIAVDYELYPEGGEE